MFSNQKALIIDYIDQYGEITPAKIGGTRYLDGFFGSETSKRCRELRSAGELESKRRGKFEIFFFRKKSYPVLQEVKSILAKHRLENPANKQLSFIR